MHLLEEFKENNLRLPRSYYIELAQAVIGGSEMVELASVVVFGKFETNVRYAHFRLYNSAGIKVRSSWGRASGYGYNLVLGAQESAFEAAGVVFDDPTHWTDEVADYYSQSPQIRGGKFKVVDFSR